MYLCALVGSCQRDTYNIGHAGIGKPLFIVIAQVDIAFPVAGSLTSFPDGFNVLIACCVCVEEIHVGGVPVAVHLMAQFGVIDNLLVSIGGLHIIIRCNVGMGRTNVVLQANARNDGATDHRGQVLRVEIGKEGKHLLVGHRALVLAGHTGWPVGDVEVVGEVAHERDGGGNGVERVATQCGCGVGESAALALAFGVEVLHVAGLAGGHELYGTHAVHVGTTVVIAVFLSEVEGKPVAVGVGEIA